ncbi:NAD-dependent epimerase/dehydratase family protein [Massilia sp. TS11]|uniref:NAD-dependent epimerase/dehydratase family protein n=1 Tax=Massilia sp. TS11 TaxID=2908003 RepID=UPI001ED9C7F0|nr:NAD-dependent epimerase/dehydratase family protein [Massilia sp. TS11]MCG2584582.1 NAD-dependent epimerase/dehydratase family protein [Massilia sp. TS11]
MRKNILVLGGTRYFGRLLVQRLLSAGHAVTIATRGQAHDPFGERVKRIRVDRHDELAMARAFANIPGYDIIYDQLCYSPLDAAIITRVFKGKVKRYVMASTIEVYRELLGSQEAPFAEDDLRIMAQPIDTRYPWHRQQLPPEAYAMGKRQAEAYLYRDGSLPVVTVRIGHVLAGSEDYTKRLAGYVELARLGAPLRYTNAAAAASFISAQEIADFLVWVGAQNFKGAINAACEGALSAFDLFHRIGAVLDVPVKAIPAKLPGQPYELSPFDYPQATWLDTTRAQRLGFQFGRTDEWLDDVIRHYDLDYV